MTHHQKDWRCGTGLCVAGWIGELTGATWFLDHLGSHMELRAYVLAVPDDPEAYVRTPRQLARECPQGREHERIIHVAYRAARLLGIPLDDAMDHPLFDARNSLEEIAEHAERHFGPAAYSMRGKPLFLHVLNMIEANPGIWKETEFRTLTDRLGYTIAPFELDRLSPEQRRDCRMVMDVASIACDEAGAVWRPARRQARRTCAAEPGGLGVRAGRPRRRPRRHQDGVRLQGRHRRRSRRPAAEHAGRPHRSRVPPAAARAAGRRRHPLLLTNTGRALPRARPSIPLA
ncbi:hypothetical protein [Nonomuraea aridisoli]|uniref:hypothetical protein n=1 Tax=Nonomuraea aridisoli TaxID=2070368 RepID=UPI0011B93658|nr:hypothetical protein [Nonomuraea aridisoli]